MNKIGQDLNHASLCIKSGKLVVFPTETVYGIGADATNEEAVKKIFEAKNRPADNPLIVHISNLNMLETIVKNINKTEKLLIDRFWPGPLSIVFEKKDIIPNITTANLNTVVVRMPKNKIALDFIEKCNTAIAAPSANVSTKPSGTNVSDIYEELENNVEYFIEGNSSEIGIESTIVKVENNIVTILRPGSVTKNNIEELGLNVIIDPRCFMKVNINDEVLYPGMRHKHYSPNTKCVTFLSSDENKLIEKMNEIANEDNIKKVFLVMDNLFNKIVQNDNRIVINMGKNKEEYSKNLFSTLRQIDTLNVDICYIQGVDDEGLGLGIMDRLIKACNYEIFKI